VSNAKILREQRNATARGTRCLLASRVTSISVSIFPEAIRALGGKAEKNASRFRQPPPRSSSLYEGDEGQAARRAGSALTPTRSLVMTVVNRTAQQTADQKLIDGLDKHKAVITALPIEGKTLTPAEAIAIVQARIDASNQSLTTKASAKAAVLSERTERAATKKFVSSLRQVIRSMFGASADILADFGLALPKPRKPSPQKKVTAAAKAKATRTLRHTMGKKQKAAIKATGPLPAGTAANPVAPGNTPEAPVAPQSPAPTNPPSTATAPAASATATPGGGTAPAASPAGTTPTHA
jgi:hypothetical protein